MPRRMEQPPPPFLPDAAQAEFLAALTHELRSPLQGLVGWVTLLRYEGLDEADRRAALEGIEQSVRAESRLLDELVELSELLSSSFSLEFAAVDLREAAIAALASVARLASERGVELVPVRGEAAAVLGDARRLRSLIRHLVTHAVRHAASGARVTVDCGPGDGGTLLAVSDSDASWAEAAREFDAVSTSPGRRHGRLTVGLAIAHHLARCHGGSLEAGPSGDGQGSTLRLRLPGA
jgi:signal transduction histidine kinase